jgi:two-component system, NarL family, response regulator NreC
VATDPRGHYLPAMPGVLRIEPDNRTRVVLAEDHETMRRGLRMVLDSAPDLRVVGEASDRMATLERVRSEHPDVLVLDLRMHGDSSMEMIHRLREQEPETEIVVLTMNDGAAFARHAQDAGARGFVIKDGADVELCEAVRAAAAHTSYTSPRVTPGLAA